MNGMGPSLQPLHLRNVCSCASDLVKRHVGSNGASKGFHRRSTAHTSSHIKTWCGKVPKQQVDRDQPGKVHTPGQQADSSRTAPTCITILLHDRLHMSLL